MNLENLLKALKNDGKLKFQKSGIEHLNALLFSAHQNLLAAKENIDKFPETAFKSAYDSALQITRSIVLLQDYRPVGSEQHKTTFKVAGAVLGNEFDLLIRKLQKYRIKRNNCVYDPGGLVSNTEAKNLIKTVEEFWNNARVYLQNKSDQFNLD